MPAALHALTTDFYPRLLRALLAITPRVMLVMQYRPCLVQQDYSVYTAIDQAPLPPALAGLPTSLLKLEGLLEAVYAPILALARTHNLCVIDLPRSMDPADPRLFECQIEPSLAGGRLIAQLIHHAALRHSAAQGSVLYYTACGSGGAAAPLSTAPLVYAQANAFTPQAPWRVADRGGTLEAASAGSGGGWGAGDCGAAEGAAGSSGSGSDRSGSRGCSGGGGGGGGGSASQGAAAAPNAAAAAPLSPDAALGRELFEGVEAIPSPGTIILDATDVSLVQPPTPLLAALLLGNVCAARDDALHAAHGVRLIVQCADEFSAGKPGAPAPAPGIAVLDLHLNDATSQRLELALTLALPAIAASRSSGGAVLVSCAAGISRSASIVMAHLAHAGGMDLRSAWGVVRRARPKACPNLGFVIQLMGLEVRTQGRGSIPPRALRAAPLYEVVFESDEEGQAYIQEALRS